MNYRCVRIEIAAACVVVSQFICGSANAAVSVTPATGVTITSSGGKYDIKIEHNPTAADHYVIDGGGSDSIRTIHVYQYNTASETSDVTNLTITDVNDVENIRRMDGYGQVWITNSEINGDLGTSNSTGGRIEAWQINGLTVHGDVRGMIRMFSKDPVTEVINVVNLVIDGDYLANFRDPNGGVNNIFIGGVVRSPSAIDPSLFSSKLG